MILNDREIAFLANDIRHPMIRPYVPSKVNQKAVVSGTDTRMVGCISYGQSGFSYDLTLAASPFYLYRNYEEVDPKNFNPDCLEYVVPIRDKVTGALYYVLPPHSYGLGYIQEELWMPESVVGLCVSKSTYARVGVIVNTTIANPGWKGHLTVEIANSSSSPVRIYANEGICQMLFLQGLEDSSMPYTGVYQHQHPDVTFPKV